MAITKDELERFNRFVEQKMRNGGADLSLEDCVRQWRQKRLQSDATETRSAFEVLSAAGLLGCAATGIGDLSTNAAHMKGFAKS